MKLNHQSVPAKSRQQGIAIPHVYVILFVFSAIAAVLTHFIPAGQYARVSGPDGRMVIDPDTFSFIDATPTSLGDFMVAIPHGLIDASEVVFFTFIIGGAFMVLRETGIIESGVSRLSHAFAKKGVLYVMWYAKKVKTDPSNGLMFEDPVEQQKRQEYLEGDAHGEPQTLNGRQKLGALLILPFVALLIWGVLTRGWFFIEISGLLIIMAIVVSLVAGLSTTQLCEAFNRGLRDVLVGAIIVGVARSVSVVLEDGQVMDTIVLGLGHLVGSFPPVLSAVGMYISQSLFNFLVPSGSGQALVTMPIMAPLADVVGVTRQTAVLAYQLGDGLTNIIFPTSGYFMAALAIAKVRWDKWCKFFIPLLGLWIAVAIIFLVFAQVTGWNG